MTFHLYGLIIGIAVSIGFLIAEYLFHQQKLPRKLLFPVSIGVLVGGVVGARLYHVVTDWTLYSHNLENIFFVWNGGLSIIGAMIGGSLGGLGGVFFAKKTSSELKSFSPKTISMTLIDIAALSLPLAQAVGRLGNYVNQELYGLPTHLPWALLIDVQHRLPGYEQFQFFHPLFAYEAIGMLLLMALLWWLFREHKVRLGTGVFGLIYGAWYGLFRGSLEFLRVDKAFFDHTNLGLNQVVLYCFGVLCAGGLFYKFRRVDKKILGVLIGVLCTTVVLSGCTQSSSTAQQPNDHAKQTRVFTRQKNPQPLTINIEIVSTAQSQTQGLSGRTEIGSDGMLFVFSDQQLHRFWMKEMKFDLDIIWIKDKKVVGITQNLPHPDEKTALSALPVYQSPTTVDAALEVIAGTADGWQLSIGDTLDQ